jgi:hypothetical protein
LFLQFLDLYGNPVYVRPERVDALRGIAVTHEGRPKAGTLIVLTNREAFRVRDQVDMVMVAIEAASTPVYLHSPSLPGQGAPGANGPAGPSVDKNGQVYDHELGQYVPRAQY